MYTGDGWKYKFKFFIMNFVVIRNFVDKKFCKKLLHKCRLLLKSEDMIESGDGLYCRFRSKESEYADIITKILKEKLKGNKDLRDLLGDDCEIYHMFFWTMYSIGGHIDTHSDGSIKSGDSISIASLLLYLNSDFSGGETSFSDYIVKPKSGNALFLKQDILHHAKPVKDGIKYLLRMDVMKKNQKK